jgi:hypothetical protein
MTYEFKMHSTERTKHLNAMLHEAAYVWNHAFFGELTLNEYKRELVHLYQQEYALNADNTYGEA